jgi:glycosyltransferase involved in cell wall biosynthesis
VYTENSYFTDQTLKFGYMHHLKGIKTSYKVIPNGIIINDWKRNNTIPKDAKSFITVMTAGKMHIKGGDLIIEIANKFPDYTFYFAGINSLEGVKIPKNIVCLGFLSSVELNRWYSKTQFYIQISNTEGFGVAVCEAMLCECVPIVSNVNYLPTIVSETGFVLKKRSVELLEILINKALTADLEQLGKEARTRIIENFSIDNRASLLIGELTAK